MSLLSILKKEKLPNGWKLSRIENLITAIQYGTNSQNTNDGNLKIVGMKNIQNGKILTNNLASTDLSQDEKNKYLLRKGDILINRTNSYELVGKVGLFNSDIEAVFASYLVRLILKKELIDSVFLNYWLNSYKAQIVIKKIATRAVSQANINPTEFKKFCEVPVPALPEQKAIASLLSVWDEAIEKTERLIEAKEKRFKWSMEKTLLETVERKQSKIVKLKDICKVVKGQQLNISNMIKDGSYYVLNGGILPSGYTNDWNTPAETISISEGGNSCGFVNYNKERFWAGGHCYTLRETLKNINTDYLYQFLKSNQRKIQKLRVGSGLPNIQKKDIENFPLVLPSLSEQKRIAEMFNGKQKEIDILKLLNEKYKTQKRGLMQKLLTGKWRVKINE